jgi:hypothetical protein
LEADEATSTEEYLLSEYDFAQYVYKLLDSKLFAANKEYVRRQILYCLLQVRHETAILVQSAPKALEALMPENAQC